MVANKLRAFKAALVHHISAIAPIDLLAYPKQTYRGRRLMVYTRAAEQVHLRGVRHADSILSTFIKHEKILVSAKRVVPRVIQPRHPRYNVEVGRYLHQIEGSLYRAIAEVYGHITVMKGFNALEQGAMFKEAWASYRRPVGIGLDASRFDEHVCRALLSWEHSIYEHYYPGDNHLRMLLSWQLRNHGFARTSDGCVEYVVDGERCSGDMNTAMGNCLDMSAMVHSYLHMHGLAGHGWTKVRLFNNGDDCMLIGESDQLLPIVAGIPDYFAQLGFVMKVEAPVEVFEQLVFCQTQPVYVDEVEVRMCRDPRVTLSKDATMMNYEYASTALRTQMNAVGMCGLSLTSGIPVVQSYYVSLAGSVGRAKQRVDPRFFETGFYRLSRGLESKSRPVSDAARVSFWRAFGIVPDLQIYLEQYFQSVSPYDILEVPGDQFVKSVILC